MAKSPKAKTNPDEAKVKSIRTRFDAAFKHWDDIYKAGDKNMKAIAGNPWDDNDRQAREQAGRPVVSFDELGQYLNQAVNEVRANPRAVKFSPTGDGANDDTARFYADLMRETEYRSNAQIAYTTAYENGLQRGFGFVRLVTEFEHERSQVQQVRIKAIANPACCYPDPDGMEPDGSDWKYFFFIESYSKDEFERTFPDAEFTDFSKEQIAAVGSKWMGDNRAQVAEYWEVETEQRELIEVQLPNGRIASYIDGVDPTPRGAKSKKAVVIQKRATEVKTVCSYLTNGVELLSKDGGPKEQPWAGQHIPFASCYGKIVWMNKGSGPERVILAMPTLALEPYMAYCFAAACELEAIGTITKNPYFAYEGSLDPTQMKAIAQSLHEPVAVLLSKPKIEGMPGVLLPLPQRNPMSIDLSAYAMVKEGARRSIQAAMGWTPLPTSAQARNEKSGVALKQIEESGQRGSYHFIDHYNDLIRRVGVMFEDLVDKLYDTDREVTTLGADQKPKKYRINPPSDAGASQVVDENLTVLPSTKGRHAVTVDVGPEFQSEREESAQFMDNFIASPLMGALEPPKRDKLMALAIKQRILGPMGEKMAEVISPDTKPGAGPDAAQAVALLQQAQQQVIPGLQAQIADLQKQLEAKVVEAQSRERIAAAADATKREIAVLQHKGKQSDAEIKAQTSLEVQSMKNEIERMKIRLDLLLQAGDLQHDREVEGAYLEQDTAMQLVGQQRAAEEAAEARDHASTEAAVSREHASGEADADRALTAEQMAAQQGADDDAE